MIGKMDMTHWDFDAPLRHVHLADHLSSNIY
jgi:hypothetical protein